MNDRYLFRGKRIDNGDWVEGVAFFKNEKCFIITDIFNCDEYQCKGAENYEVIPETVGQCTGRKYANDKLLFEGDIVECYSDYDDTWGYSHTAEYYGVIVWNANDYCWSIKVNDELIPLFSDYDWNIISMVVGNIHDNPELLEADDA